MKTPARHSWRTAYRAARCWAFGTLHLSFPQFAALAKEAAEFRRGIWSGHRETVPHILTACQWRNLGYYRQGLRRI